MMYIGEQLYLVCLVSLWLWPCFSKQCLMSLRQKKVASIDWTTAHRDSNYGSNIARFLKTMSQPLVPECLIIL